MKIKVLIQNIYVIGHAKLTKSHNVKHGFTRIIYDVVIDKRFRGQSLEKNYY